MIIGESKPFQINDTTIKEVESFKYLGSMVTTDSSSTAEIKTRLAIARQNVAQMSKVWYSGNITIVSLKKRLVQSLIWSVAMYGAECWALKKSDERRLNALELWTRRKVL